MDQHVGSTAVKADRPKLVEPTKYDTMINVFPNDSLLISTGVRPVNSDNDLRPVMRTVGTFDS
jgi:hypothetical protein